jgi:hypothetical protein
MAIFILVAMGSLHIWCVQYMMSNGTKDRLRIWVLEARCHLANELEAGDQLQTHLPGDRPELGRPMLDLRVF